MLSFDYVRPHKDPTVSLATASLMASVCTKLCPKFETLHRRLDVANHTMQEVTDQVIDSVRDVRPDVIGLGIYVWNETYVSHAFRQLPDRWPNGRKPIVVVGGPQVTYHIPSYGSLERLYSFADVFIRGYAEQSLPLVLNGLHLNQRPVIKGVHYSSDRDLGLKSDYTLEGLPSPLITGQTQAINGYIRYETKRGCAFRCSFCQHRDGYEKKDSYCLHHIQRDVQWMVAQNITDLSIVDPIFNIPSSHYLEVMDIFLKYGFKGRLNVQTRLEMVNQKFIDKCVECLSNGIKIELECGLQTVNRDEMKVIERPQLEKKIVKHSEQLMANGIPFEISLIYGLPLQTIDSFQNTIDFVEQKVRPTRVRAWPLMLLKGTELFHQKSKYKLKEKVLDTDLIPVDDMRLFSGIPHVISSSTFTEEDWLLMKSMAEELNSKGNDF